MAIAVSNKTNKPIVITKAFMGAITVRALTKSAKRYSFIVKWLFIYKTVFFIRVVVYLLIIFLSVSINVRGLEVLTSFSICFNFLSDQPKASGPPHNK